MSRRTLTDEQWERIEGHLRRHYEKPSEKRARERAAAISRARKADRKRVERDQ